MLALGRWYTETNRGGGSPVEELARHLLYHHGLALLIAAQDQNFAAPTNGALDQGTAETVEQRNVRPWDLQRKARNPGGLKMTLNSVHPASSRYRGCDAGSR